MSVNNKFYAEDEYRNTPFIVPGSNLVALFFARLVSGTAYFLFIFFGSRGVKMRG